MKNYKIVLIFLSFILIVFLIYKLFICPSDNFSKQDEQEAYKAMEKLENLNTDVEELDERDLKDSIILMAAIPKEKKSNRESFRKDKAAFSYFPTENTRLWPSYYYTYPYTYQTAGAWPQDMYSRLRHWSPGYYTGTGWQYYMRPGMGYKYWPRARWVRKTQTGTDQNAYYYISNYGIKGR